jgi:hypothetical protein
MKTAKQKLKIALTISVLFFASASHSAANKPPAWLGPVANFDLAQADLKNGVVSLEKKSNAIRVTISGLGPTATLHTLKGKKNLARSARLSDIQKEWRRLFGFSPNATLSYMNGNKLINTTLNGLRGRPVWDEKFKSLSFQVVATPANVKAGLPLIGNSVKLKKTTLLPTEAQTPSLVRLNNPPGVNPFSDTQTQVCSNISPANAGSTFCVPYATQLGSGGNSWVNILSATMQTVASSCMATPTISTIAGDSTVGGQINIYETAAEVSNALSTSASVGYSGAANINLSASYSTSNTDDTNSIYAVAQVNFQGGFVNFGQPALNGNIYAEAASISSIDDALNFLSYCGDSVPTGYATGASWISVLQITTDSQASAQSLSASLSASYLGANAAASFSSDLSQSNSAASVQESDECWGPASCFDVSNGGTTYQTVNTTNQAAALNTFTSNYNVMLGGLANTCNPSSTGSQCITSVSYSPIYNFVPTSFSANSPSSLVAQAANGVFGVLSNLNSWASGYQSLITGDPTSPQSSSWSTDVSNLSSYATGCDLANLGVSACVTAFTNCVNAYSNDPSYTDTACLPSSIQIPSLYGLANPFDIPTN